MNHNSGLTVVVIREILKCPGLPRGGLSHLAGSSSLLRQRLHPCAVFEQRLKLGPAFSGLFEVSFSLPCDDVVLEHRHVGFVLEVAVEDLAEAALELGDFRVPLLLLLGVQGTGSPGYFRPAQNVEPVGLNILDGEDPGRSGDRGEWMVVDPCVGGKRKKQQKNEGSHGRLGRSGPTLIRRMVVFPEE